MIIKRLSFKSKKSLVKYLIDVGLEQSINEKYFFETGTYCLNHGEYDRPDYIPRRYKDGWGVHVQYYYYAGTIYQPLSGRIDDLKSLLNEHNEAIKAIKSTLEELNNEAR
jgi:hypothetical protein